MRKKILWVGDAGCQSGFAKATHGILAEVSKAHDVMAVGLNYRGDPHPYPYPIVPANVVGGDWAGVNRMVEFGHRWGPDLIVVQQDGWNMPQYMKAARKQLALNDTKMIAHLAVDGMNFDGRWLDGWDHAVFWTEFARAEAERGGMACASSVVPLGVDLGTYRPMDKYEARLRRGLPKRADELFIVGAVNRNQPRKRWDLTIRYFALWRQMYKAHDAILMMHTDPSDPNSYDLLSIAKFYGVQDHLFVSEAPPFTGLPEEEMREIYCCFDVQISTTQGEGFGLTSFEGMACGVPQIVPRWSGLGELLDGACWLVKCTHTAVGMPYVGVLGGVPDEREFIMALHCHYDGDAGKLTRETNRQAGLERVALSKYRWENVGEAWLPVIDKALAGAPAREAGEASHVA